MYNVNNMNEDKTFTLTNNVNADKTYSVISDVEKQAECTEGINQVETNTITVE
jgi:hypothetical protein